MSRFYRSFLKLIFFCSLVFQINLAYAVRACVLDNGLPLENIVLVQPADTGVAVNDGIYPAFINTVYADPSSGLYGSTAPIWGMTCTAPVQVTAVIHNYRSSDPIYNAAGWPHLQTTSLDFYSFEMWYEQPSGVRLWYSGPDGLEVRGTPFYLAPNATASNPVRITLRDLNVHRIGMNAYQVKAASTINNVWGSGGTLNYMRFEMVNYTTTDTTSYFDVRIRTYIDHLILTNKTCTVILNDRNKTVSLGSRSGTEFSSTNVGGVGPSTFFSVGFRCVAGTNVSYRVQTTSRDTVGDPSNNKGLIALQGTDAATGFSIQLRALGFKQTSGTYAPVVFGQLVTGGTATGGASTSTSADFVNFEARYYRTLSASQSKSGTGNATATIDVNYQ